MTKRKRIVLQALATMFVTTGIFIVFGMVASGPKLSKVEPISIELNEGHGMKRPEAGRARPTQPPEGNGEEEAPPEYGAPKNGDHDTLLDKFLEGGITAFWLIIQAVIIAFFTAKFRKAGE